MPCMEKRCDRGYYAVSYTHLDVYKRQVLSLVTGTSYGSVGSAGVAMMAIGNAMGIHPGMVAGAVICGAMFGDKLSPLSDTTNLAPAVAGSKLNDHVRSMLWTTLPTFVISLVLFTILGISQTSGGYEEGNLLVYIDALQGEFKLGFVTLLPAVVIIVLLLCKVNAIVSLGLSAVCAGAVSFFYQGATLQSIIRVAYNGYSTQIEEAILKTILNRGGMSSMLQYVAIICFAVEMCIRDRYMIVRQFGEIVRVVETPGVSVKIPFVQTSAPIPKALQIYDIPKSDVITKDKKSMIADAFVLWKISDPVLFTRHLNGQVAQAQSRIAVSYTHLAAYRCLRRSLPATAAAAVLLASAFVTVPQFPSYASDKAVETVYLGTPAHVWWETEDHLPVVSVSHQT